METISKIGAIWVTQWRLSIKSTSLSTDEMMDGLTKLIQEEVPKCELFADDLVLADETRSEVSAKLEIWQGTPEFKGFWLSTTKIEYMECKFSKSIKRDVRLDAKNTKERLLLMSWINNP